tara:strand:+ start:894 stop:2024 length:1131 start_codon:yes stop_codon:yes gene_type:complete
MIYLWFPISNGSIDLSDNEGIIYTDMLRFVVGSIWGSKTKVINGKALGNVIKLPEIIRGFPDKVDVKYEHNVGEAKQVFVNQLTQLKETSLKKALKDMKYTQWDRIGNFEDIKLDEIGDKLREFKMQPWGTASQKHTTKNVMADKYEQPLEEFLKPIKGDVVSNYNITENVIRFDINMVYNETKKDNLDELKELGFNKPEYEEMDITFDLEDNIRFTAQEILEWNNEETLDYNIRELIYESFKTNAEYKNGILNPLYVTSFTITSSVEINILTGGGKEAKKRHTLLYSGKGNTTSRVIIKPTGGGFAPRAGTTASSGSDPSPSQLSLPDVESGKTKLGDTVNVQLTKNTIKTHRVELIEKIQGNIDKLERAIGSLT